MKKIFLNLTFLLTAAIFLAGCASMTFNDLVRKGNLIKVQQKVEDKPKLTHFKDDDKVTPLHVAAAWGYADIAKYLIEKGADINAKDAWSKTPLYRAVVREQLVAAKLLLEKGADKSIPDNTGKTPLDIAKETRNTALIELLAGPQKQVN